MNGRPDLTGHQPLPGAIQERTGRYIGRFENVGDLILNREDHAFLHACWIATAWRRESCRRASKAAGASSVDAVASRRR